MRFGQEHEPATSQPPAVDEKRAPRVTAEDRRRQVIRAAVTEFSARGLMGTSTANIAKRVGVSQSYLFRLFPTKKALFIEACKHSADRIIDTLTQAAEGYYGHEAVQEMGRAYMALLDSGQEILTMQIQQYAAHHDEDVRTVVRKCGHDIWQVIENLSGAPIDARVDLLAKGMLINMIAAARATSAPAIGAIRAVDDGAVAPLHSLLMQAIRA
jgi:AcrR family transcriptional regulator